MMKQGLGLLAVVACLGTACSNDSGAKPVAQSDFEATYVEALCSMTDCCAAYSHDPLANACDERASEVRSELRTLSALPGVTYDADAAGRCIEATRAFYSGCGAGDEQAVNDACRHVFVGTLPPGAACTESAQCAPAAAGYARCDQAAEGATGVCFAPDSAAPHAALGGECEDTCETYDEADGFCYGTQPNCYVSDGLRCDFDSSTCFAVKADGEACTDGVECANEYCNVNGLCSAGPAAGEPCDYGECGEGYYCGADGVCQARVALGGNCTEDAECAGSGDCNLGICEPSMVNEVCVVPGSSDL